MLKPFLIYHNLIHWVHNKLNENQFRIFSSVLVGITAGLAAVLLKTCVYYIHKAVTSNYHWPFQYYLYLFLPLIGILITVYVIKQFFHNSLKKGTAEIHKTIIKESAVISSEQTYSHVATSALTVGFGGSAGLESPIVSTGSAIGSNYARTYKLGYKDRVLLLACGAAAGIAGAFNAPIAGVLFSLEVLLVDATISAFIPLIMAAVAGTLCSKIILQEGILFSFQKQQPFDYHNMHFYVVLGILAGLVSVYYSRMFSRIENAFGRVKNPYKKAITGGLILAVLILLFPPLFGEGYGSIILLSNMHGNHLMDNSILSFVDGNQWFLLAFLGMVMLLKVVAAAITINSGGNGGNFAPSLFVGAYLGYCFSSLINLAGLSKLPENNFTLVAMAGILTGVFHSPLTGIFLIAEITGGYNLMIPLMTVSAMSYVIARHFEPMSMDARKLAEKENVVIHDRDKTILASLSISNLVESDYEILGPGFNLGQLVEIVAHSQKAVFPVLEHDGTLAGIIKIESTREIIFKTDLYESIYVKDMMKKPIATIAPDESMDSVMKKFDKTAAIELPVLRNGIYEGFIAKEKILTEYRKQLISVYA